MITGKYKTLYDRLVKRGIPESRMFHDSLSTLAFGTDASFYRLIPKLVIKAWNDNEITGILNEANDLDIAVTFRAAGTSLSGQAISDSVLVIASHGWNEYRIMDNGLRIALQPGIRGGHANRYLSIYGRKIGPDPASIDSAMIGGIAANNASGMCCGTSENSYKTIDEIKIILADGTYLDTADKKSREEFLKTHGHLIRGLEHISRRISEDDILRERIVKKYKIKNTTGYSLNAFTDYSDGFDILKHLVIGSEGTLAFISEITYNTVAEYKNKSLALAIYPSTATACEAVQILKSQPVSAVELIDRAGIKSVDSRPGVPEYLKTLSDGACALLIETRAENARKLDDQTYQIYQSIREIPTELPLKFTTNPKEQAILWKIRKETLPTVAGMRKSGTTAIIEDICFPVSELAEATTRLRKVFQEHGYDDAVIFGHALAGNLHFMFNQDFSSKKEIERYARFMDAVADLVVNGYDGSLKAEHGTGRNMAPFVEMEWGKQAYGLMKEVKKLFDPKGILNPGVILNEDKEIHIKNFKPCPEIRETVNKCMECGFCEGGCVSEGFTLSPRQRVAAFREMHRLSSTGEEPHRAAEMWKLYKYAGMDTCATDSLCFTRCPVGADAGKLIKELRHELHSEKSEKTALKIASNMDRVTAGMRCGLNALYAVRCITGKKIFGALAGAVRKISFGTVPQWNEHFPKASRRIRTKRHGIQDSGKEKAVYFPSCITRSMGVSKAYAKEPELTVLTEKLLKKAGYEVIYPENMDKLCCGMAFSSKGYTEAGKYASDNLKSALLKASENGKYPVLCDMSPCLYTMHTNMGGELKLYEPAEFILKHILPKLQIKKVKRKIAVFAVCSAKKMNVDNMLYDIAKACAEEVVIIDSNCCGFAGDRGFILPELNAHGLRYLADQTKGCTEGYATSRTCEIGLSKHSGMTFRSILYLVDEASSPTAAI